jgi:transposase
MLSKSATLNEVILFKNEFEKSERQREQLSDHLEVLLIIKSVYKKYAFSIDFRC